MQLLSPAPEILPSPSLPIRDTTGEDVARGGGEGRREGGGRRE